MLRTLGITNLFKWALVIVVGVAIWRGFNGDLALIADTLWQWILKGADLVTRIWETLKPK